jgi:hypothetical protein
VFANQDLNVDKEQEKDTFVLIFLELSPIVSDLDPLLYSKLDMKQTKVVVTPEPKNLH